MTHTRGIAPAVILALAALTAIDARTGIQAPSATAAGQSATWIDTHVHLTGGPRGADYDASARELVARMDAHRVATAVVMPPPRTRENLDEKETGALVGAARRFKGRLVVAAGGDVLNPLIHEPAASAVSADARSRFEREAEKVARSGVVAFGEIAALHLSFREDHPFEQVPADHPLLRVLADVAARHALPIDLHMEAVTADDMPLPAGFRAPTGARLAASIAGFERLLAYNRSATVVWQHVGWDNTGNLTSDLVERLLRAHANLFIALRVEARPLGLDGRPMRNRLVDSTGRLHENWRRLFTAFPDRFVVGSDEFIAARRGPRRTPESFTQTWSIRDQLDEKLAAAIGGANAARIYGLDRRP